MRHIMPSFLLSSSSFFLGYLSLNSVIIIVQSSSPPAVAKKQVQSVSGIAPVLQYSTIIVTTKHNIIKTSTMMQKFNVFVLVLGFVVSFFIFSHPSANEIKNNRNSCCRYNQDDFFNNTLIIFSIVVICIFVLFSKIFDSFNHYITPCSDIYRHNKRRILLRYSL